MKHYIISFVYFITYYFQEIVAEVCPNGKTCSSPYKCCDGSCCHDDDNDYIYGYRMSFWNLWYFWFIILFVLMSCFGGCGYYKQRHRILRGRSSSTRPARTIIFTNAGETTQYGPAMTTTYAPAITTSYAYSGPGIIDPYNNVFQPPPYTEVMSQPGLYPSNKDSLPPYPGGTSRTETVPKNDVGIPQPPSYSEIANQNTDQQGADQQGNQNATQNATQNS